jgi:PAS domain-containing protein
MSTRILATEFAAPERAPIEIIHRQRAALDESPLTRQLVESVLNYVFILNAQRQIVFVSRNVQELLHNKSLDSIIGMRPGEALDCRHSREMEAGCGTSAYCRECDIAKAILAGLAGQKTTTECRLTRVLNLAPAAMDLRVYAIPFEHSGQSYVMLSVVDNAGKRPQAPALPAG